MPETTQTADTATTTAPAPAPAPADKPSAKPAKAAAKAPAKPAVTAPAPAKNGETAVAATPPDEFRGEVTVQAQRKAAEAEAAAREAREAAAAGRTKSKSLDEVRAERRARAAAEEAAKAGGKDAEGKQDAQAVADADAKTPSATDDGAKSEADKNAAEDKAAAEAKPAEEAKTKEKADAKKPETTTVDIPKEKLTEFTKLNRDLTTTRARVRELEAKAVPVAAKLEAAQKLAAEGKHFEAIKAAGLDFDAAAREVLMQEAEEKETDPKVKALADQLAETRAELDKLKDGTTKDRERIDADAAARRKAERAAGEARIFEEIKAAAERFPYLSKDKGFVTEALDPLDDGVDAAGNPVPGAYTLARRQLGRDLTDQEKNSLIRAALEEGEERHAARARLYGLEPAKPKAKAEPKPAETAAKPEDKAAATPTTVDAGMRGSAGVVKPRGKTTLAEIKAARRAARAN